MTSIGCKALLAALAAAALAGCTVGPDYQRPKVAAPDTFRGQVDQKQAASLADLSWWELFKDEALAGLIKEALKNNQDLLSYTSKIDEMRAELGVEQSAYYPQINYGVQVARGQNATTFGIIGGPQNAIGANLSLASWEIDIWGKTRRRTEAARAALLASEWGRKGVILSIVNDVASAYLQLREADLELDIAERSVIAFKDTYDLFMRKATGGTGSTLDTVAAGASMEQVAATIPVIENEIFSTENQINLLLGRAPQAIPRGRVLAAQWQPPSVPLGVPSDLLQRRPDIMQAEQNVRQANAFIGAAKADFYPTLNIMGLLGILTPNMKSSTAQWGLGAMFGGPLFDGFKIYNQLAVQKAQWEQAKQSYIKTVLTAFGEVSNALVLQQKLTVEQDHLAKQVEFLRESVRLATLRYTGGLSSYYEVLQWQQQLYPAERLLAQTQRDQLLAVVQIYKSLGGGWPDKTDAAAQAPASAKAE